MYGKRRHTALFEGQLVRLEGTGVVLQYYSFASFLLYTFQYQDEGFEKNKIRVQDLVERNAKNGQSYGDWRGQ